MRDVFLIMIVLAFIAEYGRERCLLHSSAIGMCLGAEPICIGSHARCICDGMGNCHWECVR